MLSTGVQWPNMFVNWKVTVRTGRKKKVHSVEP
ncbi:hypothetical protein FKM82_022907 [Ascaphus truei]